MKTPIPPGFRLLNDTDEIAHLVNQDKVLGLCHCGHTDLVHNGFQGQDDCNVCPCLQFRWVAHVIRLTPLSPPSN